MTLRPFKVTYVIHTPFLLAGTALNHTMTTWNGIRKSCCQPIPGTLQTLLLQALITLHQHLKSNCFLLKRWRTPAYHRISRLEGNLQIIQPKSLRRYFYNFCHGTDIGVDCCSKDSPPLYFPAPSMPSLARGLVVPLPGAAL